MTYHSGETIHTRVVGVTFNGRQGVIKQLTAGEPLLLKREPYNKYDANAVSVERLNGAQLGILVRNWFGSWHRISTWLVALLTRRLKKW